ncbi:MAG: site-specific integrase [Proteobacteria bacterium]|nr:site-specific integrase [Pseudomonadota bacterium]
MPKQQRFKTGYPGVYYIVGKTPGTEKPDKIYYIYYRKSGKIVEEKAGRQFKDDMTPARASLIRAERIRGAKPSNKEQRETERQKKTEKINRWTIDKLWGEYLNNNPSLKGKATDINRYDLHIKQPFGDKEPKDIAPLDVDGLRLKLLKIRKPGTVRNVMELLRRIMNFGVKKHLCSALNFTIEMPQANNLRTEDLSPEQLAKLLEAIEGEENIQAANFMKIVLFTGMRRGELFRLQWSDIDFDRGFICIRDPKGGIDQTIPLNDEARNLLINHEKQNSLYVFPGRKGKQRTDIKKQVNKIKDKAGLPKEFRALHGLRHLFASMLASSGQVDMYTLQKLLTHKSAAMTQRYAHLRDETMRQASNLAGGIIGDAIKKEEKG